LRKWCSEALKRKTGMAATDVAKAMSVKKERRERKKEVLKIIPTHFVS
jgi:hypothetical protein